VPWIAIAPIGSSDYTHQFQFIPLRLVVSLVIFGIHLLLLGYLICRSGDIPRLIGILLAIDGLGWLTDGLQPYFYANAHLGFIFITFFGELAFMLWLLIRGWKIREFPSSSQERSHQSEIARSNPGANFSSEASWLRAQ